MSIEFGDDFLGLDLVSPDVNWGLGLVNDEGPWPIGGLDATVSSDDINGLGDVGDCGCGLGAADAKASGKGGKPSKDDEGGSGFPTMAVVAGVGGLALGIGAVLLIRKYVFKKKSSGVAGLSGYYGRRHRRAHHGRRR